MRIQTEIPILPVNQWRNEWDGVPWNARLQQREPERQFFLFSLPASTLKALTGVYRRSADKPTPRRSDPNVQRAHDSNRSAKIRDYVRYGYPWSDLSQGKRSAPEFKELRKPGWLPTALVINILNPGDERNGQKLAQADSARLEQSGGAFSLRMPSGFTGPKWEPNTLHPFEVIDGQHRLWAFDDLDSNADFHLPVVAFHGLDRSWQAYLFWTINITPKKISPSLAFDLYPLLRTEEWLNSVQGLAIYRETRSQELVEALWSNTESPWHQRINMLGESGLGMRMVTQAAWIRSLMATFVKPWEGRGRGRGIGGLFGSRMEEGAPESVLRWSRTQQAAFLIHTWTEMRLAVSNSSAPWAEALRSGKFDLNGDPAFYGDGSLINSDQGVRGILAVFNDLFFVSHDRLALVRWELPRENDDLNPLEVSNALSIIRKNKLVSAFTREIARALAKLDWRSPSAQSLTEAQRLKQAVFRGGPGYKEIRMDRLRSLSSEAGEVGRSAKDVLGRLEN